MNVEKASNFNSMDVTRDSILLASMEKPRVEIQTPSLSGDK